MSGLKVDYRSRCLRANGKELPAGCVQISRMTITGDRVIGAVSVVDELGRCVDPVFTTREYTRAICGRWMIEHVSPITGWSCPYADAAGEPPVTAETYVELQQVVTQIRVRVCLPCAKVTPIDRLIEGPEAK